MSYILQLQSIIFSPYQCEEEGDEMNNIMVSGCPKFALLSILNNPSYINDDTVKLCF